MTEESAVGYWENYGKMAFDGNQKACLTSAVLKRYKQPAAGSPPHTRYNRTMLLLFHNAAGRVWYTLLHCWELPTNNYRMTLMSMALIFNVTGKGWTSHCGNHPHLGSEATPQIQALQVWRNCSLLREAI